MRLPIVTLDFEIKIEGEEAEIVAGEVIFISGVTEADDEFHEPIITHQKALDKGWAFYQGLFNPTTLLNSIPVIRKRGPPRCKGPAGYRDCYAFKTVPKVEVSTFGSHSVKKKTMKVGGFKDTQFLLQ